MFCHFKSITIQSFLDYGDRLHNHKTATYQVYNNHDNLTSQDVLGKVGAEKITSYILDFLYIKSTTGFQSHEYHIKVLYAFIP